MLSPAIVVNFNVIKKSLLHLGHTLKFTMMNHLCFYRMEKRFCRRVIPAVTFPAHALNKTMLFYYCSKIATGILNSSITVYHQPLACGLRRKIALLKACIAEYLSRDSLRFQPTTIRENKSIKTVR